MKSLCLRSLFLNCEMVLMLFYALSTFHFKKIDRYMRNILYTLLAYIIRRNLRATFYRETILAVASGAAYKLNK